MSVKDVKIYYDQITAQYKEMVQDLTDLAQEAQEGLVEPERVDRLQQIVAPLKENYERWSYMMFLLHQPTRKEKKKKFEQQNKKLLRSLSAENSIRAVIEENNITLQELKS